MEYAKYLVFSIYTAPLGKFYLVPIIPLLSVPFNNICYHFFNGLVIYEYDQHKCPEYADPNTYYMHPVTENLILFSVPFNNNS